ncbi:Lsr2 [Clavibacter michiganensis]|uniref:Lsr2 n=1 Tax=Clavibacter michiganensis TaxID=28447 RepID=A0A251XPT9_9MICO|nr:Lsr2 [Clavibacter michiganensis]
MTEHADPRDDGHGRGAEHDGEGRHATAGPTEPVRFGLDGIVHEADLDAADARALRALLAPYVAAGRRTTVTITPIPEERPAPAGAAATGAAPPASAPPPAHGSRRTATGSAPAAASRPR